ncbi:uncharacterized protein LOC118432986 [Folsomia candida]|uniref:Lysosomal-associated transmembrane protein 4A n=1 Tax=Folsomia candida TaxID=158441 RepID=A0A226D2Y1_FOLCA|nr:uncharacterized protein LOC118432986 [Folsomia candida]OXA39503.1 Lysosomal-associated transmembrane protein 4A [Folsomia candida]
MSGYCCCNVKQATLRIGVSTVIYGIISIIVTSIWVNDMISRPDKIKRINFLGNLIPTSSYITIGCILIFMSVVYLILACVMVYGHLSRNHRLIMPWLIWSYVTIFLVAVAALILLVINGRWNNSGEIIFVAQLELFLTMCVIVVRKFVSDLKEETGQEII